MKRVVLAFSGLVVLAALGCGKSEKAAEVDAAVAAASASASASAAASASASASPSAQVAGMMPGGVNGTIPPPDRAERKAAREISKTNYKAELDSLEKEIGKD